MPSFHLFITFGLDAHHFLIRLTQTLVFLSNLFSFFQSWSNYSPHYSWEWQNTHTHTHLITLISNLKNLGMVFLHWHNKVIYPNHCPNFSLFAFLFSFSLGSKHIKEFSVSWKDPSLYFETQYLFKAQLIQCIFLHKFFTPILGFRISLFSVMAFIWFYIRCKFKIRIDYLRSV